METLIINTKNSGNAERILELVKKLGEEGKILSKEEQEDFLLGKIMEAENTGKDVGKEAILKELTTICYE
ncbi:hypothetical protein [Salinimicrobium sediminilitoris]|uniref:hypothetical protein n=1 Tax=Salinimicrobium sediminilitoris TaxID=2876715 RepID=UPI001E4BE148|nr:hypothetical protein [Salinimicrobium sediminilitoris]MCC8360098.1 hypothetical protein [Salinimicrobium sediminilitoris]